MQNDGSIAHSRQGEVHGIQLLSMLKVILAGHFCTHAFLYKK